MGILDFISKPVSKTAIPTTPAPQKSSVIDFLSKPVAVVTKSQPTTTFGIRSPITQTAVSTGAANSTPPRSQSSPDIFDFISKPVATVTTEPESTQKRAPLQGLTASAFSDAKNIAKIVLPGVYDRLSSVKQSIQQGSLDPIKESFVRQNQTTFRQPGDTLDQLMHKSINLAGGFIGGTGDISELSSNAIQKIARSNIAQEISGILQKEVPTLTKQAAGGLGRALVNVSNVDEVQAVVNRLKYEAQQAAKMSPAATASGGVKKITGERAFSLLKEQTGETFELVEPVGDLWKGKNNTIFVRQIAERPGMISKLRQSNFVKSAQEAGNNVIKIEIDPRLLEKQVIAGADKNPIIEAVTQPERIRPITHDPSGTLTPASAEPAAVIDAPMPDENTLESIASEKSVTQRESDQIDHALNEYMNLPTDEQAASIETPYEFKKLSPDAQEYLIKNNLVDRNMALRSVGAIGKDDLINGLTPHASFFYGKKFNLQDAIDTVGASEMRIMRENLGKDFSKYFSRDATSRLENMEGVYQDPAKPNTLTQNDLADELIEFNDKLNKLKQVFKLERAKEATLRARDVAQKKVASIAKNEELNQIALQEIELKRIQERLFRDLTKKRYTLADKLRFEEKALQRGEKAGTKVGKVLGRQEIRKTEIAKRVELRAKKDAEIKKIVGETRERKAQVRAVADALNLTDGELNSIVGNRNVLTMSDDGFNNFMKEVYGRGQQVAERSVAEMMVKGTIFEKELRNVENLQKALGMPTFDNMTTAQFKQLDDILQPFQQGDQFLSTRKLEMLDQTSLKGVKTMREARERLAAKLGVPVSKLENIKVDEWDRFRWDTSLAEKNPFYRVLVEGVDASFLEGDAVFLEVENEADKLFTLARKDTGILNKIVPTDEKIFRYLEAKDKTVAAKDMTPAELEAAEFVRAYFNEALAYQYEMKVLGKSNYEDSYITHIRRNVFEALKDSDLKGAIKGMFDQYKQDEAVLNILDQKTNQVLPLEKFFKFAMQRTGGITPTKNVARSFLAYVRVFERKKALDRIIPEIMAYVDVLTPQEMTAKGLYKDDRLASFVKEYLNNKKGRRATVMVKPGTTGDFILKSVKAFTNVLDLALNIPVQIGSQGGVNAGLFTVMGGKRYMLGNKRLLTQEGRVFVKKFENYTGKTMWDSLHETSKGLPEKVYETMFGLFRAAVTRGNKIHLLGSLTDAEWKSGVVTPARLAELKTEAGRWLPVEGAKSIIGSTTEGSMLGQYRTWAFPIIRTTIKNGNEIRKMFSRGESVTKSREFRELMRAFLPGALIGTTMLLTSFEKDKKQSDMSFGERVLYKTANDAMSMLSAFDPRAYATSPRTMSFVQDIMKALGSIVALEEYKTSSDTYKKGDLKGVAELKRKLTPKMLQDISSGFGALKSLLERSNGGKSSSSSGILSGTESRSAGILSGYESKSAGLLSGYESQSAGLLSDYESVSTGILQGE